MILSAEKHGKCDQMTATDRFDEYNVPLGIDDIVVDVLDETRSVGLFGDSLCDVREHS